MEIPLIYVLINAEILLVLFGLSITFGVLYFRKPKTSAKTEDHAADNNDNEQNTIDLGSTYIDFLEQAIDRNTSKLEQQQNIEDDEAREAEKEESQTSEITAPDEKQSEFLQAREQFLQLEKSAAEQTEHEINFWDSIYSGMQNLLEQYKTTETITEDAKETSDTGDETSASKDKVFYIETQGKKIDGEVNKLKDIIYEQENALSSMQKSLLEAADQMPEDSDVLTALKEQIALIEGQLSDSKMCMEVLEMENDRLQQEIDQIDARHDALFETDEQESPGEKESTIDIEQIKEVVAQQEEKIERLLETIESLEIDAAQAERLRDTLKDFTRTSQEMMSCITILEEENERLLEEHTHQNDADSTDETSGSSGENIDEIKSKITSLEEELIKKDVAYAQLQDEFSSMETEYLAMYEAMHGDNS